MILNHWVMSAAGQGALSSVRPDVFLDATSQKRCWPPFKQVIGRDVNSMFYRPPSACLQARDTLMKTHFHTQHFSFSANLSVCKSAVCQKRPGTSVSVWYLQLILLWKLDLFPTPPALSPENKAQKIEKFNKITCESDTYWPQSKSQCSRTPRARCTHMCLCFWVRGQECWQLALVKLKTRLFNKRQN